MAYSVKYTGESHQLGGSAKYYVDIICDTAADIPKPAEHPEWAVGSACIIADTKDIKILNNKREWV